MTKKQSWNQAVNRTQLHVAELYICMYIHILGEHALRSNLGSNSSIQTANINREINPQELDQFFNRHLRNYFHNELCSLSPALQKFIKLTQNNHKVGTRPFRHSAKFTTLYIRKEYPFTWLEKCDILHKQIEINFYSAE